MEGSVAQPISSLTGKFAAAAQAAARRLLWVCWLAAPRAFATVGAGIAVWIAARLGWSFISKRRSRRARSPVPTGGGRFGFRMAGRSLGAAACSGSLQPTAAAARV
ncbi:MAG: hypothetical protein R3F11_03885 [Verrucomicrobiales bacterium]